MPHRRNQLRLQRLFTFCHLIGFALFLGGTLGVTFLAVAGEYLSGGLHREFALSAAVKMQHLLLMPGAAMTLLSGVLLSATGPWGFVKHRWMIGKLVLTAILAVHSQHSFRPLTHRLMTLAQEAVAGRMPSDYGDLFGFFLRVGIIQVVVLLLIAGLGVFKPGGRARVSPSPSPGIGA